MARYVIDYQFVSSRLAIQIFFTVMKTTLKSIPRSERIYDNNKTDERNGRTVAGIRYRVNHSTLLVSLPFPPCTCLITSCLPTTRSPSLTLLPTTFSPPTPSSTAVSSRSLHVLHDLSNDEKTWRDTPQSYSSWHWYVRLSHLIVDSIYGGGCLRRACSICVKNCLNPTAGGTYSHPINTHTRTQFITRIGEIFRSAPSYRQALLQNIKQKLRMLQFLSTGHCCQCQQLEGIYYFTRSICLPVHYFPPLLHPARHLLVELRKPSSPLPSTKDSSLPSSVPPLSISLHGGIMEWQPQPTVVRWFRRHHRHYAALSTAGWPTKRVSSHRSMIMRSVGFNPLAVMDG